MCGCKGKGMCVGVKVGGGCSSQCVYVGSEGVLCVCVHVCVCVCVCVSEIRHASIHLHVTACLLGTATLC